MRHRMFEDSIFKTNTCVEFIVTPAKNVPIYFFLKNYHKENFESTVSPQNSCVSVDEFSKIRWAIKVGE